VRLDDLDDIFILAEKAKPSLTNLLPDRTLLQEKIRWSMKSFSKNIHEPDHELYFFVLEETASRKIIGTCGIFSNVGQEFFCFKEYFEHGEHYLQLVNDFYAVSELGLLLMEQEYRKMGLGKFLSRARYLFLADNLEKFHARIIALMRGDIDASGRSVFWDALGSHFVNLTFAQADRLSAKNQIHIISDSLPHTPISIAQLPPAAQQTIGRAHPFTEAAVKVLKDEGFEYQHHIDLFDGGPILEANTHSINSIVQSKQATVSSSTLTQEKISCMIGFQSNEYRICIGEISLLENNTIALSQDLMETLGCSLNDSVRYLV